MRNDSANVAALLRALAVYGVCGVLAIIIGVLMTNPMTYSALGFVGLVFAVLLLPVLLRWHHPIMIMTWGMPVSLFFIKGSPRLCLAMIFLSLVVSITERAVSQKRFIRVPQITWPLLFLLGVIVFTAKLTGGVGLRAFGSDVYGGKKYVFLVVGILGYFALTARAIPAKQARLFVMLYFLGGAINCIGDFASIAPSFLLPVFWVIPPQFYDPGDFQIGVTRLTGTAWGATAVINALIAYYGLRGIFLSGRWWRPAVFLVSLVLIFLGGFRSALVGTFAIILLQFFLEGLHRTKLMPFLVIFAIGSAVAVFPLASKLPFTFQRTLAFLPKEWIHLSPDARLSAEASTDWRIDMWEALLPEIPPHLLLGKGYAITMEDYQYMGVNSAFHAIDPSQQGLALANDYHSGPLSVILPFGIWGVIGVVWFFSAGMWVMYRNYRYSAPEMRILNTFLFTIYVISVVSFIVIFGDLSSGMADFTGLLGLSISVNRGVHRAPAKSDVRVNMPFKSRALQPAFQARAPGMRPL